jgi:RimJ/RimL family protein N-acetyltransferase
VTLKTTRLLLRPWSDRDLSVLARLAADPRVVRYIGDGRPWSADRVGEVSRAATEHWQHNNFGLRVVVPRETQTPVGLAALNYLGEGTEGLDPTEFEIGWWLLPVVWRQGLATEAANALCREAFNRVGAPSVVARVQPENQASAAVAMRLGMSYELDTTGRFGEAVSVYRLLAGDWRAVQDRT